MQKSMGITLRTAIRGRHNRTNQFIIMICNKAKVLMSAAIDGELTAKEEEELSDHLATCAQCRDEFQEAKNTKIIIQERMVRVKAPKNLIESIVRMTTVVS